MSSFWVSGCKGSSGLFILVQFFLFNLQLQHDGIKLHVQIVGSFQFALVVLPDVQCVPVQRQLQKKKHKDVNTQKNTFICSVFVFVFFFLGSNLSSSLRRLISSSSSLWRHVPSDLIFSKWCLTSSLHST